MEYRDEFETISNTIMIPCMFGFGKRSSLVWGLVDTGAVTTTISEKYAKEHRMAIINTGNKAVSYSGLTEHKILKSKPDLQIGNMLFEKINVDVAPMEDNHCDLIIGMDIITKCDFSINMMNGKHEIVFAVSEGTPGVREV